MVKFLAGVLVGCALTVAAIVVAVDEQAETDARVKRRAPSLPPMI